MKIAVMGCGNMGRAIITGILQQSRTTAVVTAYDKSKTACASLPPEVTVKSPRQWFSTTNIPQVVLIAVKPQDIDSALKAVQTAAGPLVSRPLWLSIAAGVTIEHLQKLLGVSARICRAMPNSPALIQEAVTAYALNQKSTGKDAELAEKVLLSFGKVSRVPEKLLDAVTGLSGSGPAYVYLFIESLIEGGVTAGLPYDIARQCAVQTVIGAAKMVEGSFETPSQLKAKVMSPGGTTARGLMELEKHGFKYSVIKAVTAAAARSAELGKK